MKNNYTETELRNQVKKIREHLDTINGVVCSVEYEPHPEFFNKVNYPKDYQIFMEEIGPVSIGSSPLKGEGFVIIEMEPPVSLIGFDENESSIIVLDVYKNGDNVTLADNLVVFAYDVNADLYGFDKSEIPYKFFASQWTSKLEHADFLSWFIYHVNKFLKLESEEHSLPTFNN
jgi:hypothetical protein